MSQVITRETTGWIK